MKIWTSFWSAQHTNAGQNIQQFYSDHWTTTPPIFTVDYAIMQVFTLSTLCDVINERWVCKKSEYLRSIVSSTSQERRSRARVPSCRMQFTFFKCNMKFYKECNDAIHHFVIQNVISEDFLMTPHKDEEGLVLLRPKWRQAQVRYREKLERAQICMTSFLNSGTLILKH